MSAVVNFVTVSKPGSSTERDRGFTLVRLLLGCLLLTSAGLKLYGWNVTAVPRVGWFATPRVQMAAAVWELVLGFWLLTAASRAWSWLAAASTFVLFAGISGYFGWAGVVDCGCFGVVHASPWTAFGLDMVALALLAVTRPDSGTSSFRLPAGFWSFAATAVAVLIALVGIGWFLVGSPQAALARLQGVALTVSPDHVDFGTGTAGQELLSTVDVRNWTDRTVRLIGGTSDCSCVTTDDLPLNIPPGEARPATVRLKIPASKLGAFTRIVELWTDNEDRRIIRVQIGCRIVE
jgi:hypothetical protein